MATSARRAGRSTAASDQAGESPSMDHRSGDTDGRQTQKERGLEFAGKWLPVGAREDGRAHGHPRRTADAQSRSGLSELHRYPRRPAHDPPQHERASAAEEDPEQEGLDAGLGEESAANERTPILKDTQHE
jgi:hypothetical protein